MSTAPHETRFTAVFLLLSLFWTSSELLGQTSTPYPDTARVETSSDFLLWDFSLRISDTDSVVFGPDAAPVFSMEQDSVTLVFGEHTSAMAYRAASIEALAAGGDYRVLAAGSGAYYYAGTDDPDPAAYDHKIWPGVTGASFTGEDGSLYRIAYQEFQAWTVRDNQGSAVYDCPDPSITTLEAGLERCWYNAFVLIRSSDGGRTWGLVGTDPSDYLVASSPFRFQEQQNRSRHGAFSGATGLFRVGGWYYFPVTIWGEGFQIATMMRTDRIHDASSWRYWDGEAFSIPNTDAYAQVLADPASLLPAPFDEGLSHDLNADGLAVEGLVWSAYHQAYIRTVIRAYNGNPEIRPGVYYQLSKDGFNWSGPILLYALSNAARLNSGVKLGGRSENFAYPVLVSDNLPTSDEIGETAWLAYVTFNPTNPGEPDRDIRMVRVRFATRDVGGFTVTHGSLALPEDANPGDGYCDNGYGRCSLVTALDESNARLPWLPDTLKMAIAISPTLEGDLSDGYLPTVRKPIHLDQTQAAGFEANTLPLDGGFDGQYGPKIIPHLIFGEGSEGSVVEGLSAGQLSIGTYGSPSMVTVTGSRVDSLTLLGDGNRIGGAIPSERNLFGMIVIDGQENRLEGNLIGDLGLAGVTTDRSTAPVTVLAARNELIGNVIAGTDYRVVNLTGTEASGNRIEGNQIGHLPWSGSPSASGGASLAIINGQGNRIEGNRISSGGSEGGLFLLDATGTWVGSNTIDHHLGSGIVLAGSSTENSIRGNEIHSNGGYGIDRQALQTEGNPLSANAVYDNGAGAISLPGFEPTPVPKWISAYRTTPDSVRVRYWDVRGFEEGPVYVELYGNATSDAEQARISIENSRHPWGGEAVSSVMFAVPDSIRGLVMTLTDSRPETSVLSAPTGIIGSGEGPVAVADSLEIRRIHSPGLRVETVDLVIRNQGAHRLDMRVEAGSGWVSIDGPSSVSVEPDGLVALPVTLDSRDAAGTLLDTLRIYTNEESRYRIDIPISIRIDTQQAVLEIRPDTIRVETPRPAMDTSIDRTVKIVMNGSSAIPWSITKNQPWITSLSPANGTLTPGDTTAITVTMRVRAMDALGTRSAMLVVFANIGGSNVPHELPVVLTITQPTGLIEGTDHPTRVALHPAYPNPFNPSTSIGYDLPEPMQVRLELFTSNGMRIRTLAQGPMPAGRHQVVVDGRGLASGVYVYRLSAGGTELTGRMTLLK